VKSILNEYCYFGFETSAPHVAMLDFVLGKVTPYTRYLEHFSRFVESTTQSIVAKKHKKDDNDDNKNKDTDKLHLCLV
jgi:hypothetical protein